MNNKLITGINYWPINKAMYWWKDFDAGEVEADFEKLAQNNFQLVRIFLNWEDFQPAPEAVSTIAIMLHRYGKNLRSITVFMSAILVCFAMMELQNPR